MFNNFLSAVFDVIQRFASSADTGWKGNTPDFLEAVDFGVVLLGVDVGVLVV